MWNQIILLLHFLFRLGLCDTPYNLNASHPNAVHRGFTVVTCLQRACCQYCSFELMQISRVISVCVCISEAMKIVITYFRFFYIKDTCSCTSFLFLKILNTTGVHLMVFFPHHPLRSENIMLSLTSSSLCCFSLLFVLFILFAFSHFASCTL